MFRSKTLSSSFALCLLSVSVYAQPASNNDAMRSLNSPFNYVTIQKLLAIDEQKALIAESEDAEKLGLIGGERASGTALEKTESENDSNKNQDDKEDEVKASINEEPAPLTIEQHAAALEPTLVGIYGTGSQLSAIMTYGGHTYRFISGKKQNQRPNKGNSLSLISIGDQCINVYDNSLKTKVKACFGGAQ